MLGFIQIPLFKGKKLDVTVNRAVIWGMSSVGILVILMSKFYFQNSSVRRRFVEHDPEFEKIHPVHRMFHPENPITDLSKK
ncbi:unnamed protein product [Candida verbasci]|uniref:Uncharacterized protein n=1 Tax=Candida verbasci TaxID=1227364 RepID=A0A9W4TU53_9ASCO|nr:unnamed protein product [Candida verbasci]